MGLHQDLPIYKVTYDLLRTVVDAARQMPRDVKRLMGEKMRDECLEISLLIYEANVAQDKHPSLAALLRVSRDQRYISTVHYANAVQLTDQIGKQATGWRKSQ